MQQKADNNILTNVETKKQNYRVVNFLNFDLFFCHSRIVRSVRKELLQLGSLRQGVFKPDLCGDRKLGHPQTQNLRLQAVRVRNQREDRGILQLSLDKGFNV